MNRNKTETVKIKSTPELEAYKAQVKLQQTKVHYRYAIGLTAITMIVAGFILGYFMSVNVIGDTQAKVVNSIEVSLKDQ